MQDRIEFLARTDAELMVLVRALQAVCAQHPFRLLGLKFQAGACLLHVASADGPGLYIAVQRERKNRARNLNSNPNLNPNPNPNPALIGTAFENGIVTSPGTDRLAACWQHAPQTHLSQTSILPTASSIILSKTSKSKLKSKVQSVRPFKADSDHRLRHAGRVHNQAQDYQGQDYQGQDLRGRCFAQADLPGANFNDADLRGADFTGANLQDARLQRVRIGHADEHSFDAKARHVAWSLFQGHGLALTVTLLWLSCSWVMVFAQTWFEGFGRALLLLWLALMLVPGLYLGLPVLRSGLLKWLADGGTRFNAANLSGADFSGARIGLANFHAAVLNDNHWRATVWQAHVYVDDPRLLLPKLRVLLTQGSRAERDFSGMNLSGLDFSGLDLSDFDFHGSDFSAANLQRTNLTGADLSACKMDVATRLHQVQCAYWRAADLPGGRWPPLPETMQAGEFEQRFMIFEPGVVFLANGWTQLQVWLDAILSLQAMLGIRVRQIGIQYLTLAPEGEGGELAFHIEVQSGLADKAPDGIGLVGPMNHALVCRQVWQQTQVQPVQSTSGDHLFTLLQALAN